MFGASSSASLPVDHDNIIFIHALTHGKLCDATNHAVITYDGNTVLQRLIQRSLYPLISIFTCPDHKRSVGFLHRKVPYIHRPGHKTVPDKAD